MKPTDEQIIEAAGGGLSTARITALRDLFSASDCSALSRFTMSDTPETDDEIRTPRFDFEYMGETECVDASFAKKLERERDEARSVAAIMRDKVTGRDKGDPKVWEADEVFPWDSTQAEEPEGLHPSDCSES